jgi:hypothetical protein
MPSAYAEKPVQKGGIAGRTDVGGLMAELSGGKQMPPAAS